MDLEAALNRFYVAGLISEYRVCAREGGDFGGLDYVDLIIIDLIHYREGCTAGWLSDTLGLTKSAVTKKLDSLESRGFVRRTKSTDDGRVRILELTDEAESACLKYDAPFSDTVRKLESRMSAEESETVCRVIGMLVEMLEEGYDG